MFAYAFILNQLNGAGVAGDCTTQCNFEQLCLDISYEWTRVI